MTGHMLIGSTLVVFGVVSVVAAAWTKGRPHEYLWGIFFAEWGLMHLVGWAMPEGLPRIGTIVFFGVAMGFTAVQYTSALKKGRVAT